MYKLFFIAKNNMKRQKGDMITFLFLTLLSAFLIFSSGSVLAGLMNVMETAHERMHGADYIMMISDQVDESMAEIINQQEGVVEFEQTPASMLMTDYRLQGREEWSNFTFLVSAFDDARSIGILNADIHELQEDAILLPYYIKNSFPLGSIFEMRLENDIYSFHVAGYVEDPIFAAPINISCYSVYMSHVRLEEMKDAHISSFDIRTMSKARFEEGTDLVAAAAAVEVEYQAWLKEHMDYINNNYISVNWTAMKGGGTFMPLISMGVILLFSMLILTIALVIVSFSIRNFMERNMKNTGILEAAGYTVRQLRLAIVVEILLVALIGSVIGILLGILFRGAVGNIVAMLLGLSWNQPVSGEVAAGTLIGILVVVGLVTLVISGAYKKITVLDALRGGIHAHNFKRNYFPLESTGLSLPLTLSLKETFGGLKKNLLLIVIVVILAISINVGFGMYESFGTNTDFLLDMAGIEGGTIGIMGSIDLYEELKSWEETESIVASRSIDGFTLENGDKEMIVYCYAVENPAMLRHEMLLSGRLPEHEDEVVLTAMLAEEIGAKIGDVVYIKSGDARFDFMVTGLDQKINHMGQQMMITFDGCERILGDIDFTVYVLYGKEGVTYEELEQKVKELAPDVTSENTEKVVGEIISSVSNSMKLICIVIVIVTAFVVIFVETLLIRARIAKELKNYGINKALGFTSGQLLVQTMISNLPSVTVGALIGTLLSTSVGGQLMVVALGFFGIKSVDVVSSPLWMTISFVGLLVVAVLSAAVVGLSIRKINPVELLTEE